ncbi:hypothetical protein BGW36DRAFT_370840 [Talaromyces proteolyticus]|uniref:Uncharacterized protein n=1 Tax=Talaromyces proteolyticus TaxID=1131652 RepID=A0AAD4L4R5_9EURO|nr:uncharacterized protein BGW36DRAFT_370840 [Talaromyces proteolyticus]KAH8704188.1 hypothetical protein BGW36DRAFT_370840 [Talaromyces proteolyticus]
MDGLIFCPALTVVSSYFRRRLTPRKSEPLIEFSASKEPANAFFNLAMFLNILGLYLTLFILEASHSRPASVSLKLLMILNVMGVLDLILEYFVTPRPR